jgi:hypothetical protein
MKIEIRKDLISDVKSLFAELSALSGHVFLDISAFSEENPYPPAKRASQIKSIDELVEAIKKKDREIIDYLIMAPFRNNTKD